MNDLVFISGSTSIKRLPESVIISLNEIIAKGMTVLVGDAKGVDSMVQDFMHTCQYREVVVYSIYDVPRYQASGLFMNRTISVPNTIKSERERQTFKDIAMTEDSNYCLVVWDGHSKGSYANVMRSITLDKPARVYLEERKEYLNKNEITKENIEYIYRQNYGYVVAEVIDILQQKGIEKFNKTKDLNKYLIEQGMIIKEGAKYFPTDKAKDLIIMEYYKGKPSKIKFTNDFIIWIEEKAAIKETLF